MIPTPSKRYDIVYADPPWRYNDVGCNGAVEAHYNTMTLDGIKAMPIADLVNDNAVLFMWATWPMLPESLDVIKAWGFQYKSVGFVWVKKNRSDCYEFFGLGRWTRGNTEFCLLATRGKPRRVAKGVNQLCFFPIRGHSRKPDEIRHRIVELMGDLPRVELFAREKHDGWDCWGNEVDSSIALPGYVKHSTRKVERKTRSEPAQEPDLLTTVTKI